MKKRKFEDCITEIDQEILKRKTKWSLTAINWMDYSDVSQILRIHIYKKWNMYNQSKPLAPWIGRIISNQIKNLIRNHYGSFSRPCLRCPAFEGGDSCGIYGTQNVKCGIYKKWFKSKKNALDIKIPVTIENHAQEIGSVKDEKINIEKTLENLHEKMKKILKNNEWRFYELVYIQNKSYEEAAHAMGYKTTEEKRTAGYKQIKNLKQSIIQKAKKHLYNKDIDIY